MSMSNVTTEQVNRFSEGDGEFEIVEIWESDSLRKEICEAPHIIPMSL
jgi:hypothetical protein